MPAARFSRIARTTLRLAVQEGSHTRGGSSETSSTTDYAGIVEMMKQRHALRVRRWRKAMSGCAWRVTYRDGSTVNWIESPFPKTPISLAIFLHEVGHHAIGFDRYKKRCEEEYHAWQWAITQMRLLGIEPDMRVNRRFELSMRYAVGKAMRRGLKSLPLMLEQFLPSEPLPQAA